LVEVPGVSWPKPPSSQSSGELGTELLTNIGPPDRRVCPPNQEQKMKYYLRKHITMTADEEDWMKQHGAFLDDLLNKG
jgi:hypothetical protein